MNKGLRFASLWNEGYKLASKEFFLLTIVVCLFQLVACVDSGRKGQSEEASQSVPVNDNRTFFWEIYPELVIPNSGRKINDRLSLTDSNSMVRPLADISTGKSILIFRFSKFDCNVCIDQVILKLTELFSDKESGVCLLVDGYSPRELRLKFKDRSWKFPIYILEKEKLGLSLENKNLPFLFVLSTDTYEVNKIFIPFREYPHQTDSYLQKIVEDFSK